MLVTRVARCLKRGFLCEPARQNTVGQEHKAKFGPSEDTGGAA
jgi:hypothetical protein